jgi:hypothetical protein
MIDRLKSVRRYALEKGKTTAWVYTQFRNGKLKCYSIDDIKFVLEDK